MKPRTLVLVAAYTLVAVQLPLVSANDPIEKCDTKDEGKKPGGNCDNNDKYVRTKHSYVGALTENDPRWDPLNPTKGPALLGLIICDVENLYKDLLKLALGQTLGQLFADATLPKGTLADTLHPGQGKLAAKEPTDVGGACDLDCNDTGGPTATWCLILVEDDNLGNGAQFSIGFDDDKDGFNDPCPWTLAPGGGKEGDKKATGAAFIEKAQCAQPVLQKDGTTSVFYLVNVFLSVGTTGQIRAIDP